MRPKEELVLLQTTVSPTSITISKAIHEAIYPERRQRVLHIVFSPKTKTVYVEKRLAAYLVDKYEQVSYYSEEDPTPIEERPLVAEEDKVYEERRTTKTTTGKSRRSTSKVS